MNFGEKIREIRLHSLLSQAEFAAAIGVSFTTVNRWENNKAVPNFQTIKRIKSFCDENKIHFSIEGYDLRK